MADCDFLIPKDSGQSIISSRLLQHVPRVGERVWLPSGYYQVVEVLYDIRNHYEDQKVFVYLEILEE